MILILLILLASSVASASAATPQQGEEATIEIVSCIETSEGVSTPCLIEEASPSSPFPMSEEEEMEAEEIEAEERGAVGVKAADAAACMIRRIDSQVTVLPGSGRLRLTLRYTTSDRTAVSIGLKARDDKGSVRLPSASRRLGKGSDTLRMTTRVGDARMGRVTKAKELDVSLRTPGASCGGRFEQRLRRAYAGTVAVSHPAASGTVAGSIVWTTSDSR
ncbi:MAG TPA: hypothetical protein VMH33_07265 [Solirubrobacterales bacterium]|nr:hypothetical protein [Solirubrobacterales bacterium]